MEGKWKCERHGKMLEYLCTECECILCPQCLYSHSKHNKEPRADKKTLVHLLNYAKANLCPYYEDTIDKLKFFSSTEAKNLQLQTLKKEVQEALRKAMDAEVYFKKVARSFETVSNNLSFMLEKIRFTENTKEELSLLSKELQSLKEFAEAGDVLGIIKILAKDISACNRPRLVDGDYKVMREILTLFEEYSNTTLKKTMENANALIDNIESINESMKAIWKNKNSVYSFKAVSYTHLTLPTICSV
eukprot:TRINITY_DN18965_c0_g1_i5.p1 TRINITY_DN18965_c0_g1~~TRINITY_DN18965_c0_g1_i5.p1  ORF type:complete len:246 (+),score=52.93 TRINITY_DN18965_c0_g1_i5:68-805(+)